MASKVTARKYAARITREDEKEFLFWLERTGSPQDAATLARLSYATMRQRRARNQRLKAAWDLALTRKHRDRVEFFFLCLEKTGKVKAAYLACELTSGWYYSRMLRDAAFRERVQSLSARKPNELWEHAVKKAKEDNTLLIKVLDRFEGSNQPTPPKGG